MASVVIAGSGMAGLACAVRLAQRAECLVVERLPVAGGEEWEQPGMGRLVAAATDAGVRIAAATQAVRWDGQSVLLLGAESRLHPAQALVVATGHRPLTRAELGVAGDRCGGVLPGTVAQHLLHHGVRLGDRPLVVGGASLAAAIADELARQGCEVHVAAPEGFVAEMPDGAHRYAGGRPLAVFGSPRVQRVSVGWSDGRCLDVACDALVLAHGRVPYRNVDGAILDAPGVVFAQASEDDAGASEACGVAAADRVLRVLDRPVTGSSIAPRIGVPA